MVVGMVGSDFPCVVRQTGSLLVVVEAGWAVLTGSVGSGYGSVRGVGRICSP